jgi:predicted amidophosphoribosyltransferase
VSARRRAPQGVLRSAASELADLVLRRECAGCGRPRTSWCPDCGAALSAAPTRRRLLSPMGLGPSAQPLTVWSTAEYADEVRAGVVAWKDRGRADLTAVLAQALRRAVLASLADITGDAGRPCPMLLVPAPSSRRSRRARGHDPVRDLARGCAAGLRRRGADVRVLPALVQGRRVADQAGLGAEARQQNLGGALAVMPGWARHLAGRDCLLVDDVVTTGATLLDCARALHEAGASVRGAATVAATRRRDGRQGPSTLPTAGDLA